MRNSENCTPKGVGCILESTDVFPKRHWIYSEKHWIYSEKHWIYSGKPLVLFPESRWFCSRKADGFVPKSTVGKRKNHLFSLSASKISFSSSSASSGLSLTASLAASRP